MVREENHDDRGVGNKYLHRIACEGITLDNGSFTTSKKRE